MRQIIETTDGMFIGMEFDPAQPLILNGAEFVPDKIIPIGDGMFRYANSSYVIDVKEI